MFLNVVKGAYPGLGQIDKTAALSTSESGAVERGSLAYLDSNGEWRLAMAADKGGATSIGKFAYLILQPADDLVAGMAGNQQGATATSAVKPRLTGIAVVPSQQIETDMFVAGTYHVGDLLTVADAGKFTAHSNHATVYGKVDVAPANRWVNNAWAITGWRTGNTLSVIGITTLYVPQLATA